MPVLLTRARPVYELGLGVCVFLFLPLLTLLTRGAAALEGVAGLLALGLAAPAGLTPWRRLRQPAALFAALLLWGLASALWAIQPQRALLIDARLFGLFAAGLALMAAVPEIAAPARLVAWFCAGLTLALVLTVVQYATLGALTGPFVAQIFVEPRLDQVEAGLVLLLAPLTAALALRRQVAATALVAVGTLAVIFLLVGETARIGFVLGIGAAVPVYLRRRAFTRTAAALAALLVLVAPLVFPALIHVGPVARWAHTMKISVWHRLEIWSFVGAHIARRPMLGWGLDASRAIPGGSAPTPEGAPWLPLHPHNGALQIWLELGAPGALLFALFVARLWAGLGTAPWPPLYAAAASASLVAAFVIALGSYGLWQEWWIGSEFLALFLILVMARLAGSSAATPPHGLRHR
jgi:O-antigen ligase